jgi:hypothetical protein
MVYKSIVIPFSGSLASRGENLLSFEVEVLSAHAQSYSNMQMTLGDFSEVYIDSVGNDISPTHHFSLLLSVFGML